MATGTPVERSLATASALYLLALGGLFAVPADTDDQGLLTPATQWSILGVFCSFPLQDCLPYFTSLIYCRTLGSVAGEGVSGRPVSSSPFPSWVPFIGCCTFVRFAERFER